MTDAKTTEAKAKRGLSPELQAIAKIDRILAEFTAEDAGRIIRYLTEKTYSRFPKPSPGFEKDNGTFSIG